MDNAFKLINQIKVDAGALMNAINDTHFKSRVDFYLLIHNKCSKNIFV